MMSAEYWNPRYEEESFAYGVEPNVFLASVAHQIRPGGRVLVPADGEGRNGVWLAQQGFDVTTVDISEAGCAKARKLAQERGVTMDVICADLQEWEWPVAKFDAVVSIFLHAPPDLRAALHRRMRDALVDGGLIVIEAFEPAHLELRKRNPSVGGPRELSALYTLDMLNGDFAPLQPTFGEQLEVDLAEGRYHQGRGAVVRALYSSAERKAELVISI